MSPPDVPPGDRPCALVAVGASAGGVEALRVLVGGLPGGLDAAVLVVLHIPRGATSALAGILARSGPLPAASADDGEALCPGRIYVARADHHLLVRDDRVRLSPGPAENGHRPAIDPLFRSTARAYGPRTIGVVLSGTRDDGTAGLCTVAGRGGSALVQDPDEALFRAMPQSALEHVPGCTPVPTVELGATIAALVSAASAQSIADSVDDDLLEVETAVAEAGPRTADEIESLLDEQSGGLESALFAAVRSLEEKAALTERMASAARNRGSERSALRHEALHEEAEHALVPLRKLIERLGGARKEIRHGCRHP